MEGRVVEDKAMRQDLVKTNSGKLIAGKLVTGHGAPFLARFVGKFVLDIMPAALASVIGGFLFTQYQFGHAPAKPVLEQVTPASAEMMALVRDEHAMIVDYLKTQMAAEKSRVAVQDADLARAQEDSKVADTKAPAAAQTVALLDVKTQAQPQPDGVATPRRGAAVAATKPIVWHSKPQIAQAAPTVPTPMPRPPIVIAQADPSQDAPPSDRLASDPDSLLGKALDLKDHVVAGARHAVSAVGDMFASLGGALNPQASLPRQFSQN
ncbi:MAG TPA: hypothetical protein VK825_02550 [Xanthobacteraceae bacterium]|jgi:hypothetical protein|nr:hypothetical protein [Xanthobacteraceae bacterium]